MTERADVYGKALQAALGNTTKWLDSMPDRRVPASATVEDVRAALGETLPNGPTDSDEVIDLLTTAAEPGLVATQSGRFFGFVIGGVLPAALAADWLVSAWDQNAVLRVSSPANTAIEEITGAWLLATELTSIGSAGVRVTP